MTSLLPVEVAVENSLNIYIWFLHVPVSMHLSRGTGRANLGEGCGLTKGARFWVGKGVCLHTFSTYRKLFCRLG